MTFEEKIEKIVKEYGAEDDFVDLIRNFLDGNAYAIGEAYKECFSSRETILHQKRDRKSQWRMRK